MSDLEEQERLPINSLDKLNDKASSVLASVVASDASNLILSSIAALEKDVSLCLHLLEVQIMLFIPVQTFYCYF